MKEPMNTTKPQTRENAVSPVIGVISSARLRSDVRRTLLAYLMVALTCILAAVIAAYVFGMAGTMQTTKIVNINAQKTAPTEIALVNYGGNDVAKLTQIQVKINDEDFNTTASSFHDVGATVEFTSSEGVITGRNHVVVRGKFDDNSVQVLLDTYI